MFDAVRRHRERRRRRRADAVAGDPPGGPGAAAAAVVHAALASVAASVRCGWAPSRPSRSRMLQAGRVVDTSRLRDEVGFTPQFTTVTAFDDFAYTLAPAVLAGRPCDARRCGCSVRARCPRRHRRPADRGSRAARHRNSSGSPATESRADTIRPEDPPMTHDASGPAATGRRRRPGPDPGDRLEGRRRRRAGLPAPPDHRRLPGRRLRLRRGLHPQRRAAAAPPAVRQVVPGRDSSAWRTCRTPVGRCWWPTTPAPSPSTR